MSRKGMQRKGREGGMKGKREGEEAVRDNGIGAFISLWISVWDGGRQGWRDGFKEGGRAPNMMGD